MANIAYAIKITAINIVIFLRNFLSCNLRWIIASNLYAQPNSNDRIVSDANINSDPTSSTASGVNMAIMPVGSIKNASPSNG